jgi:Anaerobic ribonucleoside-triphosphate reductase
MPRVTHIRNHDGELVPFRRARIVRAILAAIRTAGSSEEWIAEALTDTVCYFLDQRHNSEQPPSAFDLDDVIENVLTSQPDLARIARAFMDSRRQRAQLRELEESVIAAPGPEVSQLAGLQQWNRARIAAALVRENGLSAEQAGEVAQIVEKRVQALGLSNISTGLIRELVDVELLARGLIKDGRSGVIAVPRYDLEQWLFPREEGEPAAGQQELSERASRRVLTEYALSTVHDARVRDAHERGLIHIEALDAPAALVEAHLSAPALLSAGAGLGLQRNFPAEPRSLQAAFARLALVLRETASVSRHAISLERLDGALAPLIAAETPQRARQALQEGLALLAWQCPRLRISLAAQGEHAEFADLAFIDLLCGEDSGLRSRVELVLACRGDFAQSGRRLMERAASAASFCGQPVFRFREATLAARGLFGESADTHGALLARAAVNLVRPALACASGDVNGYLAQLDDALSLAVEALAQRARFLERVAKRDLPQPVPVNARMLRVLALAARDVALVPVGLHEAACLLSTAPAASAAAQRISQQILSYLAFKARDLASRAALNCVLAGRAYEGLERLHREDRVSCKGNARLPQGAQGYVAGAQIAHALPFAQRLETEGALHSLLACDARLSTPRVNEREVLAYLTQSRGVAELEISVQTRTCRDCGNVAPAAISACPACGSQAWAVPPGQHFLFSQE